MAKKAASALSIRAIVIIAFALVVIAFIVFVTTGRIWIKNKFVEVFIEQKERAPRVETGNIDAAKDVAVSNSSGGPVKTGDLKSNTGAVTVTSTPGQPKEPPPKP